MKRIQIFLVSAALATALLFAPARVLAQANPCAAKNPCAANPCAVKK